MKTCESCIYFSAPLGSEERWFVCVNPKMIVKDAYNDPEKIKDTDGVGYSDTNYSKLDAELYVGKNFGCIHHKIK